MATIIGTPGDDQLTSTIEDDDIFGLEGDDVIVGGVGGEGGDDISGGPGFDTVSYEGASGGVTVDLAVGAASDGVFLDILADVEAVIGSLDDDQLAGDDLANELTGLGGADVLQGRGGNDTLVPGTGIDVVDGGAGFDEVSYEDLAGPVEVDLEAGTAVELAESDVTDTLLSIEAAVGSPFDDILVGSAGNNAFEGLAGNDVIDGGGGRDRADYRDSPGSVTVDLASGTADDGFGTTDTLIGIEQVGGSGFDDVLTGDGSANAFQGLAGEDQIDGGGGRDRVEYLNSAAGVEVRLVDGSAVDGFGTEDTLVSIEDILGSEFDDRLVGDGADNVIEGLAGSDRINGKGGIDTVDYFFSPGRVVVDLDAGTATERWGPDDVTERDDLEGPTTFTDRLSNIEDVRGSGFDDRIRGDDASNFLDGLDGDDKLAGRGGDDILVGGNGDDVLRGGGGSDVFLYRAADEGVDLIKDWSSADVIDLRDVLSGTDDPEANVRLIERGADTVLRVDPDGGADGFVDLARLEGATGLSLDTLIDNGNIVVSDAVA